MKQVRKSFSYNLVELSLLLLSFDVLFLSGGVGAISRIIKIMVLLLLISCARFDTKNFLSFITIIGTYVVFGTLAFAMGHASSIALELSNMVSLVVVALILFAQFPIIRFQRIFVVCALGIVFIFVQGCYHYFLSGTFQSFRGDRNLSGVFFIVAVIILKYFSSSWISNAYSFLIVFLSLSRSFLVSILFLNTVAKRMSVLLSKLPSILITASVLVLFTFAPATVYFAVNLDIYQGTVGSKNDYSRFINIFDGSNMVRGVATLYVLNDFYNDIPKLLVSSLSSKDFITGDVAVKMPHSSYLEGIIRVGLARFFIFLNTIIEFIKKEAQPVMLVMLVQGVFIHEVFFGNCLIFALLISLSLKTDRMITKNS